jgi:hypothetical protein
VNLGLVDEAAGVAEVLAGLEPGDRVIVGNVAGVGQGTTGPDPRGRASGPNGRQAAAGSRPVSDSSSPGRTP